MEIFLPRIWIKNAKEAYERRSNLSHQSKRRLCDGKVLLEIEDSTFTAAGGVGLWAKADAATFFDDLQVTPAK